MSASRPRSVVHRILTPRLAGGHANAAPCFTPCIQAAVRSNNAVECRAAQGAVKLSKLGLLMCMQLAQLAGLAMRWRRLELASWHSLLDRTAARHVEGALQTACQGPCYILVYACY